MPKRNTHDASDNVGDLHEVVINDIGKMVCRKPICLHENEVALVLVLLVVPIHGIRERRATLTAESDDMALATRSTARRLVGRDAAAGSGIVDQVAAVEGLLLVLLEVFGRAEASVSVAAFQKLLGMLGVVMQALGLLSVSTSRSMASGRGKYLGVWAVRATDIRALVPIQLSPFEITDEPRKGIIDDARLKSVSRVLPAEVCCRLT
jgi:hypothetical protein